MTDPAGQYPYRPVDDAAAGTGRTPVDDAVDQAYDPRLTVEPGRFFSGTLATALVTALVAFVGVLVFEVLLDRRIVPPVDLFSTGSHQSAYAIDGALFALLAAGILVLLAVSTPRPTLFFGWLMVLALIVLAITPFTLTSHTDRAIFSAIINVAVVASAWSLLAGVASRTIHPARPARTTTVR